MTIYEKENALWQDYCGVLPKEVYETICIDGLCPCRADHYQTPDREYIESPLRIVFVSKDMNKNQILQAKP